MASNVKEATLSAGMLKICIHCETGLLSHSYSFQSLYTNTSPNPTSFFKINIPLRIMGGGGGGRGVPYSKKCEPTFLECELSVSIGCQFLVKGTRLLNTVSITLRIVKPCHLTNMIVLELLKEPIGVNKVEHNNLDIYVFTSNNNNNNNIQLNFSICLNLRRRKRPLTQQCVRGTGMVAH